MKIILVCLSFYLIFNILSVFGTSNAQLHHQENNTSNISHTASHLQGLAYQQQQQAHPHDITIVHQRTDTINNKNNRVIQQNRPRFQRGKYQPQAGLQNDTIQDNSMINNRLIHPKFRPWLLTHPSSETQFSLIKTSTIISNSNISSIQLNQPHLADGRSIVNTTKSSSLLDIFTPKPQTRGRVSYADYYFQRQLRAFFNHQHDKLPSAPSPSRSNIKTGL